MDMTAATAAVGECFALADKVDLAVQAATKLGPGDRVKIVASDFYGGHWLIQAKGAAAERRDFKRPKDVLTDALRWLTNPKAYARQGAKGN